MTGKSQATWETRSNKRHPIFVAIILGSVFFLAGVVYGQYTGHQSYEAELQLANAQLRAQTVIDHGGQANLVTSPSQQAAVNASMIAQGHLGVSGVGTVSIRCANGTVFNTSGPVSC